MASFFSLMVDPYQFSNLYDLNFQYDNFHKARGFTTPSTDKIDIQRMREFTEYMVSTNAKQICKFKDTSKFKYDAAHKLVMTISAMFAVAMGTLTSFLIKPPKNPKIDAFYQQFPRIVIALQGVAGFSTAFLAAYTIFGVGDRFDSNYMYTNILYKRCQLFTNETKDIIIQEKIIKYLQTRRSAHEGIAQEAVLPLGAAVEFLDACENRPLDE